MCVRKANKLLVYDTICSLFTDVSSVYKNCIIILQRAVYSEVICVVVFAATNRWRHFWFNYYEYIYKYYCVLCI